jgi:hypothetical protein
VATSRQATLTVQLAGRSSISSVTVTRGSVSGFGYMVQTSADGTSWQTVATAPSTSSGAGEFTFHTVKAQYVRLYFPGGSNASTPEIDELAVS